MNPHYKYVRKVNTFFNKWSPKFQNFIETPQTKLTPFQSIINKNRFKTIFPQFFLYFKKALFINNLLKLKNPFKKTYHRGLLYIKDKNSTKIHF